MRQKQRTGLLNVQLRDETHKRAWKEAEEAVASALDTDPDELTRSVVARELCEAYTGNQPCGRWRGGSDD